MSEVYWDPFDVALDDAPYETWRRMRDERPLYRNERYDFWALSRYTDVEAAHRDPDTYSSAYGTVLETMGPGMSDTGMMIFLDPPEHTRLRHLVSRAFTPRRVQGLEGQVRQICAELLDEVRDRRTFDYVQDFGAILPSRVISILLGVPPADQEDQRKVVDNLFHLEPEAGIVNDVSITAALTLTAYLRDLLVERHRHPREDLLSALSRAEIDEDGVARRLTPDEAASFAVLLFAAGTETVARLLGNAAVILTEHPGQRSELAERPSLVPNAIEELLRYEAPSPVQGRWTTRPVELYETAVPANSKVLLLTGSAGRDERAYPEPDRFDVHRRFDQHLSFGYGIHFCVGAALARLEGRVALEETLRRYATWEVDLARARRLHTSTVSGWESVPIDVRPGTSTG
jgi:cytochrome P450